MEVDRAGGQKVSWLEKKQPWGHEMAQNAIITHIIVAMRVQEIWTLNRTYTATMVGKSFHILILPIDNLMINFNAVSRTPTLLGKCQT